MLTNLSLITKRVFSLYSIYKISFKRKTLLTSIASSKPLTSPLTLKPKFFFGSSQHPTHPHSHNHDPILKLKSQLQAYTESVKQKHPNQPSQVIKQIYIQCQKYVGENKRVQILLLFEILSEFIQMNNLLDQYSAFNVMSANNSFIMGRYKEVVRRCQVTLPYELKKHGQIHKNIADLYNMLGISISKTQNPNPHQALEYLQKAYQIRFQLLNQSHQTAQILFNSGIILQDHLQSYQKAQKHYLDATQMHQNSGLQSPLLYLRTKMRLADVQLKIHQTNLKYISDVLRIEEMTKKFKTQQKFAKSETTNVDLFLCFLHKNLGKAFMDSTDFPKAIEYFEACLKYLRDNKMQTEDRIFVLEHCAASYVALNNYKNATTLFEEGDKVLGNLPATDEYKYHYWRYQAQIYRRSQVYPKEIQTLERMRNLQKNTQQGFVKHEDICQVEMSLIFALGNARRFEEAIAKGHEALKFMTEKKGAFSVANRQQDYISNIYAYIGYGYMSKTEFHLALEFFNKSNEVFSALPSTHERIPFHMNVLRKLAVLEIQVSKNLAQGFKHLEKLRNLILGNNKDSDQKKLKDLVILILEYEINDALFESPQQMVDKMIEAKYVQNINNLIEQIVKILKRLSGSGQGKETIESSSFLVNSVYQMLLSFNNDMKAYEGKYESNLKMKNLLEEIIQIYDKAFAEQIREVNEGKYKGDQSLKELIKSVEGTKRELEQLELIK